MRERFFATVCFLAATVSRRGACASAGTTTTAVAAMAAPQRPARMIFRPMVASLPQASIKSDTLSLNAGAIAEFRLKRARHWQNAALTHNVTGDLSWTGSAH